ncbi:MAG: aspartate aminotransferase family protein [Bacteroidia bacterium]|nr:aspartate aminotransferase family protein [Bacteroidia bacterium]
MLTPRQIFLKHLAQTSPSPPALEMVRAEGSKMWDAAGKEYIDLISGIGVSVIGHRHAKVVKAIKDQADLHLHLMVYGELIQSPQVKLAEKLSSLLPSSISSFYFVNSGSEATEGALKLAKRATGRTEIIAFKNAYHGSTHGALSVMGNETLKQPFRPLLPEVRFIEFNREEQLREISNRTACVIAETIQGEAGVVLPQNGFLKKLRKRCDETGALLILDEIQCGIGRTGKMFAFEHYGITPDILCLGKALGGGMPIGCFASSQKLMATLSDNPALGHITTFGGHPLSCAAALATLEVLTEQKDLIASVPSKSEQFRNRIESLKINGVKEIRNAGWMMAVEFTSREDNFRMIHQLLQNGIITDWFLFDDRSLRIAPPLTISEEELTFVLRSFSN